MRKDEIEFFKRILRRMDCHERLIDEIMRPNEKTQRQDYYKELFKDLIKLEDDPQLKQ